MKNETKHPKSINRRSFIQGGAAAMLLAYLGRGGWISKANATDSFIPFVLHIYVSGGWDQTMVFDNKLTSDICSQETGATSATGGGNLAYVNHPNRPAVKTFFDTYGANAAIVNGISSGAMDRVGALKKMMGAIPDGKYRYADWLSFYTYSTNPVMTLPHVVIDAPWMPGDYNSVAVKLTSDTIDEYTSAIPNTKTLGSDGESALTTFRSSAYSSFYTAANEKSLDNDKLKSFFYSYARESNAYSELVDATTTVGDTTGDSKFLRNGKIAIELFAQGASQCATVQAGLENEWDTTTDHYNRQSEKFQNLFSDINDLFSYASSRNVLEKMIVIVSSERGRAPILNDQNGKGSWAFTSVLLWGVGIRGGTVAGLTDKALRGLPIDPIFGGQSETAPPLEMGNIFSALYLKTNVPTKILLPNHKPLSPILLVED